MVPLASLRRHLPAGCIERWSRRYAGVAREQWEQYNHILLRANQSTPPTVNLRKERAAAAAAAMVDLLKGLLGAQTTAGTAIRRPISAKSRHTCIHSMGERAAWS
jgi:hypothetical protein